MAAPTNTSAGTAINMVLPYSTVQTGIHDAGTTYSVFYKTTATTTGLLSVFGFGDLVTYQPKVSVLVGIGATPYLITLADANKAIQVPVTAGTTYWFEFTPNAGNPTPATLTLTARMLVEQTAPAGSIVVNDDTEGFPAIVIDTAGNIVKSLQGIVAGEAGDVLDNGIVALADGWNDAIALYDSNWNLIATSPSIVMASLMGVLRTCQGTQRFWFTYVEGGARKARSIDSAGTLGTAHTLTAIANVQASAASNDETILYHCASGTNAAIRRWDLVNDVALSNLVAGIASYQTADILVLSDSTIIVSYIKTSATFDVKVLAYDSSGATLQTYNFGSTQTFPGGTFPRLAYGQDATSFWIWTHPTTGASKFEEVKVSDGSILTTVTTTEFEGGIYQKSVTATPAAYFGNSFSCPFLITRTASTTPPDANLNGPGGIDILRARGTLQTYPIRRVRIAPVIFDEDKRVFLRRVELFCENGNGTVTGQGQDPTVELHVSKDNGYTYPIQRTLTTGRLGDYSHRCYGHQWGEARRFVLKFIQTDPVNTIWIGADVTVQEGLN